MLILYDELSMLTDCVYKHILQPTSTAFTVVDKGEDEEWTQKVLAAALLSLVPLPVYLIMEQGQNILP